ncbi:MAG: branched-chain amino acid ABC transporter permease [Deltaproteobacteria bacterium]|nr:branched-chain amino acid ABC transporter permease [Deltaproteobacteria bacterium]
MNSIVITQILNVNYEITTLIVIAIGLAVILGLLNVLNMAHGEFIMIGAYCGYMCQSLGWPYLMSIPIALCVCTILGWVVERLLIRPLYNRPFDTLLATWGLSLLLREVVDALFGKGFKSLNVPVSSTIDVWGLFYPTYRVVLICIAICGIVTIFLWYSKSNAGMRIKAMVSNPDLAQAVGIDTGVLARNTFITGTCFGGLAGVMVAPLVSVHPYMGLDYILKSFFVPIVGGFGSLLGLVSGSAIIGGVESITSAIINRTYGYSFVLIIAILFLWLRPNGIFSRT